MPDMQARNACLAAMGIDVWLERHHAGPPEDSAGAGAGAPDVAAQALQPGPESVDRPEAADLSGLGWEDLAARVAQCTACGLDRTRTRTVFGTGATNAGWLIVGEAPGADEDLQGEPFVGRAGKLLNAMLGALGMRREEVYIANILKCRPPSNRDPSADEVACCEAYLRRQVELLQPRLILAVGRIAAQNLLKRDTPIGRMRGQVYTCPGTDIPVVVTYHPAYLLRSPQAKAKSWDDLRLAQQVSAGRS